MRGACGAEEVVKVHLVEHSLHKGESNLERGVAAAQRLVEPGGVLLGDEAFPVKLGDGKVLHPLHTLVTAHAVRAAHILHGDDPGTAPQVVVVHHNDPVGPVDVDPLHPCAGGEHEPVVGVQLGELATAQLQIQHNAPPHRLPQICPDKRKPPHAAHGVGALKGGVLPGAVPQVQGDALRPEQRLRQSLESSHPGRGRAPVEDAGEVHIAQGGGQVLHYTRLFRGNEPVPVEGALNLEEQGVLLLLLTAGKLAPPGGVPVESDGNSPVLLLGVAQDGLGGEQINPIAAGHGRASFPVSVSSIAKTRPLCNGKGADCHSFSALTRREVSSAAPSDTTPPCPGEALCLVGHSRGEPPLGRRRCGFP